MRRVLAAMAVTCGLLAGFSSAAAAAKPAVAPGTQLWVSRYNGPASLRDFGSAVAVSPDGRRVFVTGRSSGKGTGFDFATVAYNAATGARLWVSRYGGPADSFDTAHSIAVSPDGKTVFVTGAAGPDAATIAYNAATGARRWASSFRGSGCCSNAWSVAVSVSGNQVFVTGGTNRERFGAAWSIRTIAYAAATGAQLWTNAYAGAGGPSDVNGDWGVAAGVSPLGGIVYVAGTGLTRSLRPGQVMTLIAYNGRTGIQKWASTGTCCARASSMVVGSGAVVVTAGTGGSGQEVMGDEEVGGTRLWTAFPGGGGPPVLAASPTSNIVFAASTKVDAYLAASGGKQWAARFAGQAHSAVVNAAGTVLYVAGSVTDAKTGPDYLITAYNTANGRQLWTRTYHGPADNKRTDEAWSVAVSKASQVFVTGNSVGPRSGDDYATIAYQG